MKITLLGTGSIVPTEKRFSSGILVNAGGKLLLLDIGPGCMEKLRRAGVHPLDIDAVLITHFHIDHVADLLPMIMARAYDREGKPATAPKVLQLIGPKGFKRLVSKLVEEIPEFSYLTKLMRCYDYLDITEVWEDSCEVGGVRIFSRPVEHYNGVAYRLEAEGKSIVYSGDTIPDKNLVNLAKGCDLLIHECSFPHELLAGKHTSERQLIDIIREARPGRVAVTHMYPAWEGREEYLHSLLHRETGIPVIVGKDMMTIEL